MAESNFAAQEGLSRHEFNQGPVANEGTILAVGVEVHRLTACLLEPIDGVYRLAAWRIAPSREQRPLVAPVQEICRQLGARLQRTLWDEASSGPLLQSADPVRRPPLEQVVISASPRPRLRVWLAGLTATNSWAAARAALDASQAQEVGGVCLSAHLNAATLARDLDALRPEVIVLSGGYEGGQGHSQAPIHRLINLLAAALHHLPDQTQPEIVFAGTSLARPTAMQLAQNQTRRVQCVENVLPAPGQLNPQPLAQALDDLYAQKCRRTQGFGRLAQWNANAQPILSVEAAFTRLVPLWMELHGLRGLHSLYAGGDRWLYVWANADANTVQVCYTAPGNMPLPAPSGAAWRPPLQLVSGPWPDGLTLSAGVLWRDPFGLAPSIAAAGSPAPAAALQALRHDVLLPHATP